MKKIFAQALLLSLTISSLSGCIFVAGAAAGAAAIAVVYDHRKIELTLADAKLAHQISDGIGDVPALKTETHITVTVFNHVVLLTGQAPNASLRAEAESIAHSLAPNARVYNQITLEGPTSGLTRTSDAWITTKIRTLMLAEDNLKSSTIKVITENGVVYLMGVVKPNQANLAVEVARRVSGVQKVIKVFQ